MLGKTTFGELVVLSLSVIIAFIATFSKPVNESGSYIAGMFIGSFIGSIIILYIFYWIITKIYPKSNDWGIIVWIIALIGIPLLILIILAVLAAFVFGMTGASPAPVQSTEISKLPAPVNSIPAATPVVQEIPRPSIQGWKQFTIPQTHLALYTPEGWTTTTRDVSYGGKEYTILASYSPDMTTAIGAFGMDLTGVIGGPLVIKDINTKGYIDADTYDGFVAGLTSGSSDSPTSNIIKDPNYYSLSGHPARKVEYDQGNTHFLDYFLVPDQNTMVVEMLMTTSQATPDDIARGQESLKSVTG